MILLSDLTVIEKRKLERALGMGGGYVLDFSNNSFAEFFYDSVGIDIYDEKYYYATGSKANRMRAFWEKEGNHTVWKVLSIIFNNWDEFRMKDSPIKPPDECLGILQRLKKSAPVSDVDNLVSKIDDKNFELLVNDIRGYLDRNKPEAGLDRLHTFVIKYLRNICTKRGLDIDQEKPLHSIFGEYIKLLKKNKEIESVMTERILKSTISVMDAFNTVRNDQSFAHDNQILNYDESLLIFNHIIGVISFISSIEDKNTINEKENTDMINPEDEIPF